MRFRFDRNRYRPRLRPAGLSGAPAQARTERSAAVSAKILARFPNWEPG